MRIAIDSDRCERKPTREEQMALWAELKNPWGLVINRVLPFAGKSQLTLIHAADEPGHK
jgi:hypothetical protein